MNFLFWTILFPFLGFIILVLFQKILSSIFVSFIGIGSIAMSLCITFFGVFDFLGQVNSTNDACFFIQPVFTWISVVDFIIPVGLRIDRLSLSMLTVITVVSFLIHLYSSWYMTDHVSYALFFSYMNLFVANMILLVLADNLLLMYFGWEGVGLCSYLLIGFYHSDFKNGEAALKAFIMTRIGDIFLICAMFMLYSNFHTLDFSKLMFISSESFLIGHFLNLITVCLLIAAVAKSAQLPLQTWLLNAMVAPAPVSALIHAATMITAGVYLISRMYFLFVMTPEVLYMVGIIGSLTLLLSSFSALVQNNIKKILAYSTMGQVGYMFLALSVQAKDAAIFHLTMHSFFKALLFLASGSLILICRGEQNIFKMGKVCRSIPSIVYYSFLIGGGALSAVPIISAGFYSKGDVLWKILLSGNTLFIFSGVLGSFLTSLYTFRIIFVIFPNHFNITMFKCSGSFFHYFPLLLLSLLSTVVGTWVRIPTCDELLSVCNFRYCNKLNFELFMVFLIIFGFCLSSIYYMFSYRSFIDRLFKCKLGKAFLRLCFIGWGFDRVYKKIFIFPYLFIAYRISSDPVNSLMKHIVFTINFLSYKLMLSECSQLRYYMSSMVFGLMLILLILVFL